MLCSSVFDDIYFDASNNPILRTAGPCYDRRAYIKLNERMEIKHTFHQPDEMGQMHPDIHVYRCIELKSDYCNSLT